nr:hypothetical protein [uncultured Rhodopila sp.]
MAKLDLARVLVGGDAGEQTQALYMLRDLAAEGHRDVAEKARALLQRADRAPPAGIEDRGFATKMENLWTEIGRSIRHPALPGLVGGLFSADQVEGPRLAALRSEVLGFLVPDNAKIAAMTTAELQRVSELFAAISKHPDYRSGVAQDRLWLDGELFDRRAAIDTRRIDEALSEWNLDEARAILIGLGSFPSGLEAKKQQLSDRITATAHHAGAVERALRDLADPIVRDASDASKLDALVEHIEALGRAVPPPRRFAEQISVAGAKLDRTIEIWLRDCAVRCGSLQDVLAFVTLISGVPPRWQAFEREEWFERAWPSILTDVRNTCSAATSTAGIESLTREFNEHAERLPATLMPRARAIGVALAGLARAWQQAADLLEATAPDMTALGGADALPAAFNEQVSRSRKIRSELGELEKSLIGPASDLSATDIEAIAGALHRLPAEAARTERAAEVRRLLQSARHSLEIQKALASRNNERLVELVARTPEQRAVVAAALGPILRLTGAVRPADTLSDLLAWWREWFAATPGRDNVPSDIAGLDSLMLDAQRNRLVHLSDSVQHLLEDRTLRADDLLRQAEQFNPVLNHPQIQLEQERILTAAWRREAEEALKASAWDRAEAALSSLCDLPAPPDWVNAIRLQVVLGREAGAGRLAQTVTQSWSDIQREVPEKAPDIVLAALRERCRANTAPDPLDHRLIRIASEAVKLPQSEKSRDELSFRVAWADMRDELDDEPEQWRLVLATRSYSQLDEDRRLTIAGDVRRLVDGWLMGRRYLLAAWAYRVFRRGGEFSLAIDPLDQATRVVQTEASALRARLQSLRAVTQAALGEIDKQARVTALEWKKIATVFETTRSVPTFPPVPEELSGPLAAVEALRRASGMAARLDTADFTEFDTITCAAAMISILANCRDIPAAVQLRDKAERVHKACTITGAWLNFSDQCRAMEGARGGERSLQAALAEAKRMEQLLASAGLSDAPGGRLVARRALQALAVANPRLPAPDPESGLHDVVAQIERLLDELDSTRRKVTQIELNCPSRIIRPELSHYDTFFGSFPSGPPIGRCALEVYREMMRREPMPEILSRASSRLPGWIVDLACGED